MTPASLKAPSVKRITEAVNRCPTSAVRSGVAVSENAPVVAELSARSSNSPIDGAPPVLVPVTDRRYQASAAGLGTVTDADATTASAYPPWTG